MPIHCLRPVFMHSLVPVIPAILIGVATNAHAETLSAWNFNTLTETATLVSADHGDGVLDLTSLDGAQVIYDGTDLNAVEGDGSGSCFGVRGSAANGSFFELSLPTNGAQELSFAYRTTATGFDENIVQIWNGSGWSTVGAFGGDSDAVAEWQRAVLVMSDAAGSIDDAGDRRLRFLLDGAESANGVIRFDNIRVTSVPAPAVGAIGGMGGLAVGRGVQRRR